MTNEPENRLRPNANYKLSKPDGYTPTEEELNFYYSRERRLAKAPQSVKDLYTGKKQNRFNLLRPLIADKPRAILFFTIVVICLAILLLSILGYFDKSFSFDGNKLEISGIRYEEITIVMVKKTVKSRTAYSGAVDIAVSPVVQNPDDQYPVFYHRIFFSLEPEEEYSFTVPFDDAELAMVLHSEKSALKITIKPN
ncbi:MAG: hypothetical protein LBQ89_06110 [Treponema sp.]|jgi:hypothetical protein|nr:hypothetical protein [Treponema sp.]